MVSIKERKIKGKTYVYVSASATYKGETKRFEKSVGPKDLGKRKLARRIKVHSEILEMKKYLYLIYLETKNSKFRYVSQGYAYPIVLIRRNYEQLKDRYPSELKQYQEVFDIKYIHHTNAIEGNTITLQDTELIISHETAPSNKKLREIHEIENYKEVLRYGRMHDKDIDMNFILKLHQLIQRNIDDNTAGSFRRIAIGIRGSSWEPPPGIFVDEEMKGLLKWYNKNRNKLHPLELAGMFHHKFEQIHPFVDGNGRVGRELINFILRKNKYPPLIIPFEKRSKYMSSLEKANNGDVKPLLEFLATIIITDHFNVVRNSVEEIQETLGEITPEEMGEIFELVGWYNELMGKYIEKVPKNVVEIAQKIFLE